MELLRSLYRFFDWDGLCKNNACSTILKSISIAIVVLSLAKCLQNIPGNFDITLYDESIYLLNGIQKSFTPFSPYEDYLSHGLGNPIPLFASYEENGLYSGFYAVLSQFITDPVELYLYGANILTFLWLLIVFFCFVVLSRSIVYSSLALGIFLLSPAINITPRVSFAAIIVIAIGLMAAFAIKKPSSSLAILMLDAFICCFVRPEFVLTFYLLGLSAIAVLVFENLHWMRERSLKIEAAVWLSFAGVALLSFLWSFPIFQENQRAFAAFAHGVALHVAQVTHSQIDPWTNWQQLFSSVFPGATTIADAFRTQPAEFVNFVASNIMTTSKDIALEYFWPRVLDFGLPRIMFVFALVLFAIQIIVQCRRNLVVQRTATKKLEWPVILAIGLFLAPVMVACTLIYPLDHYVVMVVFLLLALVAVAVGRIGNVDRLAVVAVASLAVFINAPVIPVNAQPVVAIVRKLQAAPKVHNMLEIDGGWCIYLMPRCKTIFAQWLPQGKKLQTFIDEMKIDGIFLSPRLVQYSPVAADPYFVSLLKGPVWYGWDFVHVVPVGPYYLLVRKNSH
jgi:hypothetical protein